MSSIIVVGSLNMDLVVRASRLPQVGETVLGTAFDTIPGGKGANQAVAAARLGGRVAMVGRVGQDGYGQTLVDNLRQNGVDVSHVAVDQEAATGVALIAVGSGGENQIIVYPGANGRVQPADVDAAGPWLQPGSVLVCQFEIPVDTVAHALQKARAQGVITVLNPAPALDQVGPWIASTDYIVPNETEAAGLTGQPVEDDAGVRQAARTLREMGAGHVVITLGQRGAYWLGPDGEGHVPAFPVQAVDTTAAGDAFVGALAVALTEGMALPDAVRFGCAAGAVAVTRFGAQPSLPARADVDALLDRP